MFYLYVVIVKYGSMIIGIVGHLLFFSIALQ